MKIEFMGVLLVPLLGVALLTASPPGHAGLQMNYYPNTGWSPSAADWRGAVLDSDIIVETRPVSTPTDAFTVTRSLHGPLKNGDSLLFAQWAPIQMETAPTDTLRAILRAPIVDRVLPDHTLPVEEVDALAKYPLPQPNARYIVAVRRLSHESGFFWLFPIQTVGGDLLLIQDDRVYITVPVAGWRMGQHERRLSHVWVPHPYTPRARELERALKDEIAFKDEFLRVSDLKDPQAKIKRLARYIVPFDKPRVVYAYRAIELIAQTGATGTAYLREHAATPPLSSYLFMIVEHQRRDRAALPWLRTQILRALDKSPSLPWPKRYCDPDTDAMRETIVFLCKGAETLAVLDDAQSVHLIRASIAWQLAQGRDWWVASIPFTLTEERYSRPLTSKPVPESDPLILMSRAMIDESLFRPYPPWTEEHTDKVRQILRQWVKQYGDKAIPGLLWMWGQDHDPDVYGSQRGIRPKLARAALTELLGKDLGNAPMPYWQWYLKNVLKAQAR